ncbi:MAG: PTS sugar transporter subunit IIA [Planctomycetota bacterium]|jgi:PTS system nitrogen regulatory IIA component|nr:PTS sugar transporter subunit IIA [Planctomycetota bacterium]
MQNDEYDLDSLSAYLHIEKKQAEKLVSRGKIPGKRVDGKWKFSAIEVHHWLEERLGVLDPKELAQVEQALGRQTTSLPEDSTIAGLLAPATIAVPLQAKTKSSVIQSMCEITATTGLLWDVDKMFNAVKEREEMFTTALDCGAALLHPRRIMSNILGQPLLALGVSTRGIPFGGSRSLTDVFWLICSTDETTHLKTLARISRLLSTDGFLEELRGANDPNQAYEIACRFERQLL